jgi:hypothetical protein
MDEIEQAIADGRQAERLMSDPVLQKALDSLKNEQIRNFRATNPPESDKREQSYYMLKAIESLEAKLNGIKSNGEFEQEKIKRRGRPPRIA